MKTINNLMICVLVLLVMSACSTDPKPIDYGNEGCHFCKMTIVDKIHGAQLVTDKGKVFTFDATECMINYITDNDGLEVRSFLTNYYEAPTAFITAQEATFLVSENLPSPMGANLTAFQGKANAEVIQVVKGGDLYNWDDLKAYLNE